MNNHATGARSRKAKALLATSPAWNSLPQIVAIENGFLSPFSHAWASKVSALDRFSGVLLLANRPLSLLT